MKPYKYILLTVAICLPVYFLLNIAWYYSSSDYKPSSVFVDVERKPEQIEYLWEVYRKGHTQK